MAKHKYNELKSKTFTNTNAKEWYQHISKIINNGKRNNTVLSNIPELAQKPLTEIVEIVNSQFASICQTNPPLNNSPMNENPIESELKLITEEYTYKLLEKYSKKSLRPRDFPRQIIQEYAIFLALPFTDITNCAIKSGVFPDAYKISEIVPIPKKTSYIT